MQEFNGKWRLQRKERNTQTHFQALVMLISAVHIFALTVACQLNGCALSSK